MLYEIGNVLFFPMANNGPGIIHGRDYPFLIVYVSLITTITQEMGCKVSLVQHYLHSTLSFPQLSQVHLASDLHLWAYPNSHSETGLPSA